MSPPSANNKFVSIMCNNMRKKQKNSNQIAAHSQLYVLTEYTTHDSVQDEKKKFSHFY